MAVAARSNCGMGTMDDGFPKRLRETRKRLEKSQASAAIAIGKRPQTWYHYEAGTITPPQSTIDQIVDYFRSLGADVSAAWLVYGNEEKASARPDKAARHPALVAFLESAEGVTVTHEEREFLEGVTCPKANALAYHFMLMAHRACHPDSGQEEPSTIRRRKHAG